MKIDHLKAGLQTASVEAGLGVPCLRGARWSGGNNARRRYNEITAHPKGNRAGIMLLRWPNRDTLGSP